jgi:hypothetical protein
MKKSTDRRWKSGSQQYTQVCECIHFIGIRYVVVDIASCSGGENAENHAMDHSRPL